MIFLSSLLLVAVSDGKWWGDGKVHPKGPKYIQTWDMAKSTGIMICNVRKFPK